MQESISTNSEQYRINAIKSQEKGQDGTELISKMATEASLTLQNQDVLKKKTISRSFYGFWKV